MRAFKSKYHHCLEPESDLQVAVSTIQWRMSHTVSNMQAHPSTCVILLVIFTLFQFIWLPQAKTEWFPWQAMTKIKDQI
jgi:hypothetical protein